MSDKESQRRKISRWVMRLCWKIIHCAHVSICKALKLAWMLIKGQARIHYTKVRGVSYDNGQKALRFISRLAPSDYEVVSVREQNNIHDHNAIGIHVVLKDGRSCQIGYLSKSLAADLAGILDAGGSMVIIATDVTGLNYQNGHVGMNIGYVATSIVI